MRHLIGLVLILIYLPVFTWTNYGDSSFDLEPYKSFEDTPSEKECRKLCQERYHNESCRAMEFNGTDCFLYNKRYSHENEAVRFSRNRRAINDLYEIQYHDGWLAFFSAADILVLTFSWRSGLGDWKLSIGFLRVQRREEGSCHLDRTYIEQWGRHSHIGIWLRYFPYRLLKQQCISYSRWHIRLGRVHHNVWIGGQI